MPRWYHRIAISKVKGGTVDGVVREGPWEGAIWAKTERGKKKSAMITAKGCLFHKERALSKEVGKEELGILQDQKGNWQSRAARRKAVWPKAKVTRWPGADHVRPRKQWQRAGSMPVFAYLPSVCFYPSAFPRLPWQWKTRRQEEERGQSISPFLALVAIWWQWWHLLCPCSFPPDSPFLWGHSFHQVDPSWLSSLQVLGIGCLQPQGGSGFLLWLLPIHCIYATKSCINIPCWKY